MRRAVISLAISCGAMSVIVFSGGWVQGHKTPTAQVKIIQLKNGTYAFSPKSIKVKPGTEVIWDNVSGTDHTITFAHHASISDIPPGSKKHLTFKTAGTYHYACEFHPYMKAQITVKS